MSDSVRPHGLWPTRLLCPQDSLGKNIGVGCHFLLWALTLPPIQINVWSNKLLKQQILMCLSLPFNNITANHEKRELQTLSWAWKSVSRSPPKFHRCLCELSCVALLGPCEAWIDGQEPCFQKYTGLAKKFVWVFHDSVWKTWMNFLANPIDVFRKVQLHEVTWIDLYK